ncbi:low molecular weight protein-tyrosine-phosphatase [Siculibacillus lacustris]
MFVCLGNICRSPLAEGAFRAEAARIGLQVRVASAGIGPWHVGEPPDPRSQAVAARHGVDISGQRGRQVKPADFLTFDHIVALDWRNLTELKQIRPNPSTALLSMLLDHAPGRAGDAVADPYYKPDEAFEITWSDVVAGTRGLAAKLKGEG